MLMMIFAAAVAVQQPPPSGISLGVMPPPGPVPTLVEPGPAAMAVAAMLLPRDLPVATAKWQAVIRDQLLRTVLASRGIPCDQKDSRCIAAADKVAARNAPLAIQSERNSRQWLYGIALQQKLSASELASAERFLASTPGAGLRSGLAFLLNSQSDPSLSYAISTAAYKREASAWRLTTALEEFYDSTVDLPRSQQTVPPPPIYAPPAAPAAKLPVK